MTADTIVGLWMISGLLLHIGLMCQLKAWDVLGTFMVCFMSIPAMVTGPLYLINYYLFWEDDRT